MICRTDFEHSHPVNLFHVISEVNASEKQPSGVKNNVCVRIMGRLFFYLLAIKLPSFIVKCLVNKFEVTAYYIK